MDLFEYQGKQYFARYGIPVSAGGVADTVEEAVAAGRQGRLPGRRQGPGPGRRAGQGGRHQAGRQRRRGPPPRRQHPRPGHQGPRGPPALGRARLGHRQGVLRQLHPGPGGQEVPRPWCRPRAASRSRQVADEDPGAIARLHIDPSVGLHREPTPASWSRRPASTPRPATGRSAILLNLYRCYVEGDADLVEINPLILTPDGRVHALDAKVTLDDNAAFRHPEWDEFRDIDELDERERLATSKGLQYVGLDGDVGIIANGAGLAMSTCDVVNQVGGSPGQLPRHRRRRQRRGHGQRPRGHQLRPERPVHLHQHLRRHHPGRGSGQRHRARPRSGSTIGAPMVIRLDGTNAEEGRQHPEDGRVRSGDLLADHARRGPQGRRAGRQVEVRSEHLRRREHQGPRPGPDRRPGPLPRPAQPGLRHQGGGRRHARQGRPGRRGHPGLRHRGRGRGGDRGQRQLRVGAPAGAAAAAILEAAEAGIPFVVCITEGIPAHDEARVYNTLRASIPGPGCSGPTARGSSAPASATSASPPARSPCPAARSASSAGRAPSPTRPSTSSSSSGVGVTTCVGIGGDPVPGTNFVDCLAAFEADPDTRAIIDVRRDRRVGGGEGGRVHRHGGDQAGRRLHRRRDRSAGQEDGPRRRHHLRLQGHRPGQDGGPGRRRRARRQQPHRGRPKMAEIVRDPGSRVVGRPADRVA